MEQDRTQQVSLCTIGYEGWPIESYVERLLEAGVRVLCDVRKNPISRRKGFSKNRLRTALEAAGIGYRHFPELGIPTEERRAAKTPEKRRAMFARYARETIPREGEAIGAIAALVVEHGAVALTCVEHDPHDCHRSFVADAVAEVLGLPDVGRL